ncbi:unnamed protein product [Spirodela intermedia]|uniref:Uncharacterized protein n=1 Tax=Spirodela intermedia TaxID=51605 RepID=A0A7I8L4X5_SPIIN|nr:unnamed protein product [Spirodela intermedia]
MAKVAGPAGEVGRGPGCWAGGSGGLGQVGGSRGPASWAGGSGGGGGDTGGGERRNSGGGRRRRRRRRLEGGTMAPERDGDDEAAHQG